jgi:hypothetical protein
MKGANIGGVYRVVERNHGQIEKQISQRRQLFRNVRKIEGYQDALCITMRTLDRGCSGEAVLILIVLYVIMQMQNS